jgi:hypothetical protein
MIDRSFIGRETSSFEAVAERGRLRFFAHAIGEQDPVYSDLDAARAAGHGDLPVPPTFLFGLDVERPDSFAYVGEMGIDLRHVLHGEQSFAYHRVAVAGEPLRFRSRIADLFEKKGGALQFVVREITVTDGDDAPVADLRTTIVVRDPRAGA